LKIAVIGAGPTGCAAALSLARAGAEVSLISDGRHGVGEHLPAACTPLLQQLGLQPPDEIACTGILSGELICDFLVDASGRRGVVARRLGIPRHRYCRQRALVGWLNGPAEEDATLCVEELGANWAYTCRIAPGRRVAALLGSGQLDWSELQRGRLLGPRLRDYVLEGSPRIVPADSSLLEEVSGPGWLALGDAAASTNPLVGQGLFAALQAGISASRLVGASAEALRAHRDGLRDRFHQLLLAFSSRSGHNQRT